ncbi:hypothetical protein KR018_002427 [Drosophila ironensis]|nr:hypothetical protein KR018_002427 [Drosophila ironensis]
MLLQKQFKLLLWLFFIAIHEYILKTQCLPNIIQELNTHLRITTNIVYSNYSDRRLQFESKYLRRMPLISLMIYTSTEAFNATEMQYELGAGNKLFIILSSDHPPYDFFRALNLQFQQAEFIIVMEHEVDLERENVWLDFVIFLWQEGYVHILFYSCHSEQLYHKIIFPRTLIEKATVGHYLSVHGSFRDLYGYPIRVAAYNNAPRSMIYNNRWGRRIYAGFYMRFVRAFINARNATFVPVHTPSDSPGNCTLVLQNGTVDVCADALAANPAAFSLTHGFRIASANVLVTHAKPLHSYRYLTAPFQWSVWLCLGTYVVLVVSFLSLIHWMRSRRWDFSKHLLEVFSSLLFSGFYLKELHGKERYILFGVLFVTGFVYSTEYLGLLKSMLISEVFEKQINTFEELAENNITLLVDPYDKLLFAKYNMPPILFEVMEPVPFETLLEHRNRFDQDYAYVLFSDRMALYDYAQQFLRHPKLLRIPIDFAFLYTGLPMRKRWFLKQHLAEAWYWAFESGLTRKLALDADFEAIRVGYVDFLVTEHMEAVPLGLDYFVMPAIALALGYSLALVSFVVEMTARRMDGCILAAKRRTLRLQRQMKMETKTSVGCLGGGDVDFDLD